MIDYKLLSIQLNNAMFVTIDGHHKRVGSREIAKKIGVSYNTVCRIERGNKCDLESYEKICEFLNVSLDTFSTNKRKSIAPKPINGKLEEPFYTKCEKCSIVYLNWVGSTPCCGSLGYLVDEHGDDFKYES